MLSHPTSTIITLGTSLVCNYVQTNVGKYINNVVFTLPLLSKISYPLLLWGWSGGAMVLGKLPVPGRPTIWIIVGQGPAALVVGAGGGCLDIFFLSSILFFSSLSLSLGDGPI